jgi:putative quorum-sensing-regulated virulence factor
MPFGKFKGKPITDLPDAYITWLLALDLHEPLRARVRAEAAARGLIHESEPMPITTLHPVAEELIGAGLRVLARKHHPDVGGDVATMQTVNAAADWLGGRVRELAS